MRNLRTETEEIIRGYGRGTSEVQWVGSRDGTYAITWEAFVDLANVEYDPGYGSAEVSDVLVVVAGSWWLERHEYDGSEWWEFKRKPIRKRSAKPFTGVIKVNYDDPLGAP